MEQKIPQSINRNIKKNTTNKPTVSIITPVINCVKYIEQSIQSVLNQKYPYIEHVIVDGGSTDGTLKILSNYQIKYPDKITFILSFDSKPGKGCGEAWNKGLKIAKGEIFGWLGADDILSDSDVIDAVVDFFKTNPNAYFVHGGCNFTNAKGKILRTHKPRSFTLDELINDNNHIANPSSFYKRAVVEKVGYLDQYGNDLYFMIKIAKVFKMYRIDKPLSNFRMHNESETGSKIKRLRPLWFDYQVSRQNGGRFFSGYHKRYYQYLLIELLRPTLGPFYPFLKKNIKKVRDLITKKK